VTTDLQLSLNFRAWDKGRNDLSIYLLQPRNKNVRLGLPSCSDPPYA
ncbi:unnamed protein product, partial [Linum tenue]